jgi:N-acetylglucosaminyldiphosphoundecaprenol N-acetyl-beta-D-mannosaminyltransferase
MQRTKSSPLRVAVVGGERGVAIRAASSLKSDLMEIVLTADGYPDDWLGQFKMIRESHPDVLILGLGMPLEALTLQRYANELPACVIITCGGWLRLLAGLEKRSPVVMQELRLEWLWRLFTDPRRTWRRYVLGGWHITRIALDRYDGA